MISGKAMQISDTMHGTIQLSEIEKQIISTPIFNRLHNISQNSTVYLTFPSNRTKRFEHSLGAMELCGKIFYYSVCNADKKVIDDFFLQMEAIVNNRIDSWLITILKKHYFDEYALDTDTIGYQLEELLANKRYYYSVVKKAEDFLTIDSSAAKVLSQGMKEIYQTVDKLGSIETNQLGSDVTPIDPFLNKLKLLKERVDKYLESGSTVDINGFILASIKYEISFFANGYLDDIISNAIRFMIRENFNSTISNSLVVFKNVKTGVNESLSLCSRINNKDDIKQFNKLSKEAKVITQDRNFLPVFYVYILKSDSSIEESINFKDIKEKIGECVGNTIVKFFKDELGNLLKPNS